MNKGTDKVNYRHYEIPLGSPILALLEKTGSAEDLNDYDHPDSLHFHNHLEIGFCYYGNGLMTFDDKQIPYGSNIFTVIPRGIPHMTGSSDRIGYSWEYLIIDVNGFLSDVYKAKPHLSSQLISRINRQPHLARAEDQKETAALIRKILDVMRNQQELCLEEARGLVLALLIRLARWNRIPPQAWEYPHHAGTTAIISSALDYINREPGHPFKIEELARMCHISETHFRRVFSEYMKMSPVKYINQVRIRHVCDELTKTNDSINAIAARTGFPSLSTFNRNFRQITGLSPQQFRKHPELYTPNLPSTPPTPKWLIMHIICSNMATRSFFLVLQCIRIVYEMSVKCTFCLYWQCTILIL